MAPNGFIPPTTPHDDPDLPMFSKVLEFKKEIKTLFDKYGFGLMADEEWINDDRKKTDYYLTVDGSKYRVPGSFRDFGEIAFDAVNPPDENDVDEDAAPGVTRDGYAPVWECLPYKFKFVAVDPDGKICAYTHKPYVKTGVLVPDQWYLKEGDILHIGFTQRVSEPSWTKMLYERPK